MLDAWRGSGPHSVTVPPMDGALRPNQAIEQARQLVAIAEPDNLVRDERRVVFSSGAKVMTLDLASGASAQLATFSHPVTCLAAWSGCLAVGLENGEVLILGGPHDGAKFRQVGGCEIVCPTAMAFADSRSLLLCLGSQQTAPSAWKRDLMARNASGSVWRVDIADNSATCLADRLAYPYGIGIQTEGDIIVAESWRSQLIRLRTTASPEVVLPNLPGYPARLTPHRDGEGWWMAVFAPRNQLIEFVLREDDYRVDMMRECEPDYWVAPSLHPPRSFLEPLQGGALKQLGTLKPWAPSRSCGLVVQLDRECRPTRSFHSRANGARHGVTSCVDADGVLATCKGGDVIVSIDVDTGEAGQTR
jgi:hypothetical protein